MLHRIISTVYVISSPVPLATQWNPHSEWPAHGTRCSDNQRVAPPLTQHTGPDFYSPVPLIDPFSNAYGGPRAPTGSSAVVQSQPHNMPVPGAQGLAPMDWLAPPHDGGVEEPQLTFHNYTDSRGDFAIADADAIAITRPMSSGSSDETVTSNDEWIGTLDLNGTRVLVRALMSEAIGDQCVHAFD
jgi:hypothetical protein